jgi:hypothetical protein
MGAAEGGGRDEDVFAGLVIVKQVAGSCDDFGGGAAAICLGWLLSAAGGDEMFDNRCSVCWSVYWLLSVCLLSRRTVLSWLLLLYPTAMCLGLRVIAGHVLKPSSVSGSVIWCFFCVTISWFLSWYVWTSFKSLSAL